MNKRKRKSAEKAPPFKDHSPKQVKEVALMLYAQRPFPLYSTLSEFELNRLVWQANDLLDKLDVACEEVARQRKAGKRSPEKKSAEAKNAKKELPHDASGNVRFNEAVKFITGEKHRHVKRAKTKFLTVLYRNSRELGYAEQETDALLARWEKNGMPRDEVIRRRALWHEEEYHHYKKLGKAQLVNVLLKAARTGEIE